MGVLQRADGEIIFIMYKSHSIYAWVKCTPVVIRTVVRP
jgi:hypothetical protein